MELPMSNVNEFDFFLLPENQMFVGVWLSYKVGHISQTYFTLIINIQQVEIQVTMDPWLKEPDWGSDLLARPRTQTPVLVQPRPWPQFPANLQTDQFNTPTE